MADNLTTATIEVRANTRGLEQDAGVSLDELIALVTSAQQTTARGGAVIGNSFKTYLRDYKEAN